MFETRQCPGCGSADSLGEIVRPDVDPRTLSLPEIAEIWQGFQNTKVFFPYRRCARCGLAYAESFFRDSELFELYSSMHDNIHSEDTQSHSQTYESYKDQISGLAQGITRVIELGPDIGTLASKLNERHGPLDLTLVEPNRAVHDQLRAIPANSVTISETIDDVGDDDGGFDLAVAIHVFDHLKEPVKLLGKLHRLLKPGGTVFAVTHNERSLMARALGRRWPGYDLQHPHLFNRRTLAGLLKTAGFGNIRVGGTSNVFPAGYLVEHAMLAVFGRQVNARSLPGRLRLPLGNIFAAGRRQ